MFRNLMLITMAMTLLTPVIVYSHGPVVTHSHAGGEGDHSGMDSDHEGVDPYPIGEVPATDWSEWNGKMHCWEGTHIPYLNVDSKQWSHGCEKPEKPMKWKYQDHEHTLDSHTHDEPKPTNPPVVTQPTRRPTNPPVVTQPTPQSTSSPVVTQPSTEPTTSVVTQPSSQPATTSGGAVTRNKGTDTSKQIRTSPDPASEKPKVEAPVKPLFPKANPNRVYETEFMLVDLGGSVPQWFELYNANSQEIDLTGWKFYYRKTGKHVRDTKTLHVVLTDIKIPARGAIILATHETTTTSLDAEKIYVINTKEGHNVNLKSGWKLTAPGTNGADDIIISEQPRDEHGNGKFGEGNVQRRLRGKVKWKRTRTSFEYRRSEEVEQREFHKRFMCFRWQVRPP